MVEKTIELRKQLNQKWRSGDLTEKIKIANFYVKEWGKIKGNKEQTIEEFVSILVCDKLPSFQGIATWSKIAAIKDPTSNFIFDARVALSLNALQFLKDGRITVMMPRMSGRNKLINKAESLLYSHGERKQNKDGIYQAYLSLLRKITESSKAPHAAEKAEMLLFAKAEELSMAVKNRFAEMGGGS